MSTSRWEGAHQGLLHGAKRVKSAWDGFRDFALRDNVLEVAVGLMIASAFTTVVNSFVSDILLPPISIVPGLSHRNLEEQFVVLRLGPGSSKGTHYNTVEQAHEAGAVTLNYGEFLDKFLNFVGLGLVLYVVAQIYAAVSKDSIIKHTKSCLYCRKEISEKAARCCFCTSWQDGREDQETSAL